MTKWVVKSVAKPMTKLTAELVTSLQAIMDFNKIKKIN